MDFNALAGLRLLSLRLMNVGTHPAWVDASTPQIATYAANLELAEPTGCVQVRPCEVSVPNQYPVLGIELYDWPESPSIQTWNGEELSVSMPDQLAQLIPARIIEVHIWDSMGEGVTSALDLVLSTGVTLTLRHMFPPMMLGLDVRATKDMSSNPAFQRTASPPLN